jgi:hypothetical protein
MLCLDELLRTFELNFAVEPRPDGHHDHDSSRLSGPPADSRLDAACSSFGRLVCNVGFNPFSDPETGELLFRPIARG